MIAEKTTSEILVMPRRTRCDWYKTISPEEKEEAMRMMENVRRVKIGAAHTGMTRSKDCRANMSAAWTPERRGSLFGENNNFFGKKHNDETKTKISMASKQLWKDPGFKVKQSIATKEALNRPEVIAKMSVITTERWKDPEYRTKMSTLVAGEKNPMYGRTGESSPNWQGGISTLPYGFEFNGALKRQIRARDNHTCQECQQNEEQLGYVLAAHHIDYDKKNNRPENLICLCRSCHTKTNFSREDWVEYFGRIMEVSG